MLATLEVSLSEKDHGLLSILHWESALGKFALIGLVSNNIERVGRALTMCNLNCHVDYKHSERKYKDEKAESFFIINIWKLERLQLLKDVSSTWPDSIYVLLLRPFGEEYSL